jgi:hypothetical protein
MFLTSYRLYFTGVSSSLPATFSDFRFTSEPADVVASVGQPTILDCSANFRYDESATTSGLTVDIRWMKDGSPVLSDSRRLVTWSYYTYWQ